MGLEIILQECFLSDPLPKLKKWCRSAKQNGIKSKKKKKKKKKKQKKKKKKKQRKALNNISS